MTNDPKPTDDKAPKSTPEDRAGRFTWNEGDLVFVGRDDGTAKPKPPKPPKPPKQPGT